jgi:type VI secretion system secreted protein Hcp
VFRRPGRELIRLPGLRWLREIRRRLCIRRCREQACRGGALASWVKARTPLLTRGAEEPIVTSSRSRPTIPKTEVNMRTRKPFFLFLPRRVSLLALGGIVAAVVMSPGAVFAAEEIFLKIEGIKGESSDGPQKNAIVLLSYSQSFTRSPSGGVTANCGAVKVTKQIDRSSAPLIGAVLTGRRFPTAVITFRRSGPEPFEYYKVTLTDVHIESIIQTDASPTDPTSILEQITLTAVTFKFEYTMQSATGAPTAPIVFAWDCVKNSAP